MTLSDIPIVNEILTELVATYSGEMISVYGIGSFFDDQLPSDWIKNDIDFVVIVKTLESPKIPRYTFTDARFKNYKFNEYGVSLGFNVLSSLQNKEKSLLSKESYANYEWAILELKLPSNSVHLLGEDIRPFLPEISNLDYDYDDILARSLYHLDRSLKKEGEESKKAFTKAVFKFCFYLCLYFDKDFAATSIKAISVKLQELIKNLTIDDLIMSFLKEAILYRRGIEFKTDYLTLRNNFNGYIFSLLGKGVLHRTMRFSGLVDYLENIFGGLTHLKEFAYRIRKRYYAKKSKKKIIEK